MKRRFRLAYLLLCTLLTVSACSVAAPGAKTAEELAERYLSAVITENYESVLDLLPKEIVEYGIQQSGGSREGVVDYVRYAAYDYSWLKKLPTKADYSFEITEIHAELPAQAAKESILLEEDGVRLYVQNMVSMKLSVDVDGAGPITGSLFAVQIDGRWYLTSVAGDDEMYFY